MMSGTRVIDESPSSNSEKFHVLDLKTVRLQTPPTLNSAAEGVGNEDHGVSGVRKPRAKGWRIVLKKYRFAGVRKPRAGVWRAVLKNHVDVGVRKPWAGPWERFSKTTSVV